MYKFLSPYFSSKKFQQENLAQYYTFFYKNRVFFYKNIISCPIYKADRFETCPYDHLLFLCSRLRLARGEGLGRSVLNNPHVVQ